LPVTKFIATNIFQNKVGRRIKGYVGKREAQ
jgi:hypothetical protein